MVIPLSIVMMVTYYFVNRHFDKKIALDTEALANEKKEIKVPLVYAFIPILPILLLIVFSKIFNLFNTAIALDTTTAMFISVFIALLFEFARTQNTKAVLESLKIFWNGMGNIFKTVVTLIIAADIFAKGLISLGFVEGLLEVSQNSGFGVVGIGVVMTVLIFFASMLMGSGNASFFAFGPLVPKIADKLGIETTEIILPMQLSASMGRTVSPISGVMIATAEIAKVSTLAIVKRNIIPLGMALLVMLIYHFI
jgi:DcuC family C4-dicarboxylate transporter